MSWTCATGGPQIRLPASSSQTQCDLICLSAHLLSWGVRQLMVSIWPNTHRFTHNTHFPEFSPVAYRAGSLNPRSPALWDSYCYSWAKLFCICSKNQENGWIFLSLNNDLVFTLDCKFWEGYNLASPPLCVPDSAQSSVTLTSSNESIAIVLNKC